MANQLLIEDIQIGAGAEAQAGQRVTVHYRGTLTNGTKFDGLIHPAMTSDARSLHVLRGFSFGYRVARPVMSAS